jgi:hypothetical protein
LEGSIPSADSNLTQLEGKTSTNPMKNLILKIQLPDNVDPSHLYQSVMDAIQLSENVTNAEAVFIDLLLSQVMIQAKQPQRIALIWHVDDVLSTAEDMEDEQGNPIELTTEQAEDALLLAEKYHDANEGLNWDSIREAIRVVIK